MKLKYLFVPLLPIVIMSCSESEIKNEEQKVTEPIVEIIDEIVPDTLVVEEQKDEFKYFEDYAAILTKTELLDQFGELALLDGESWYAEGTVKKEHSLLVNPKNGHIVKFLWDDDGKTLTSFEATYYMWNENLEIEGNQEMVTKDGLRLGMSLDDLKEWNGVDFEFSGFGWDYAGGIFEGDGSKLDKSNVEVTLLNDQKESNEGFDFIIGDVELSTAESRLMGAPILVEKFTYYIEKE